MKTRFTYVTYILLIISLALLITSHCYWYQITEVPAPPAQIRFLVPEKSSDSYFECSSDNNRHEGQKYLIKREMNLEDLPSYALCNGSVKPRLGRPEYEKIVFDCIWDTPGGETKYVRAFITETIPLEHRVERWEYDNSSFKATPKKRGWFSYNSHKIQNLVFFGSLTALSILLLLLHFELRRREPLLYSEF